jgi:hypothetical protein
MTGDDVNENGMLLRDGVAFDVGSGNDLVKAYGLGGSCGVAFW